MKIPRLTLGTSVALAAVLVGLAGLTLLYAAPTEEDLAKVKIGMTKPEVIDIMGKPNAERREETDGLCSVFVYKSVGRYRLVNIWFDCDDKVRAIDRAR